jgi:nucleoside-diphosphate kinase
MMIEKTLVLIKPDAVERGLIGKILAIFEQAGLRIAAMKMLRPTKELVLQHYPDDQEWVTGIGEKTVMGYKELGLDLAQKFGTEDPFELGEMVRGWLVDYIASTHIVALILEGNAAVAATRKLCGHTVPTMADPGSIRGKYSCDSAALANTERRTIRNLVHASSGLKEASAEIALWFPEHEG